MNVFLISLVSLLPALIAGRSPEQFIVGGDVAANGAWPWQLSLRFLGSHSCGASLITSTAAACAAHCIGSAPSAYVVVAGTNNRLCPGDACETRRANSTTRHPDFTNSGLVGYPNDVSVITWTDPILEVAGQIQYIQMSTTSDQVGQECYITGWGRLMGGGSIPDDLQEAVIDVLAVPECQAMWSALQVHDTHICVYDRATQARGACQGDSGGPLVCRASSSSPWLLAGATSWGNSMCDTAYPSVYTRISSYYDWINSMIP